MKQDFEDLVEDERGAMLMMLGVFGFAPKEHFTFEALRELEDLINEKYPEGHKPMPTTLIPFGWYLMKTLEKRLPEVKIYSNQETIWDIQLGFEQKTGGEFLMWPFRRIDKYWKNREDRLSSMLEMTIFLAENDGMDPEVQAKADADGWIELPRGTMFRIMRADKEGNPIEPKDDNKRHEIFENESRAKRWRGI